MSWHIGKIRMHAKREKKKKKKKIHSSLSLSSLQSRSGTEVAIHGDGKLMICLVNICSAICSFSSRFLNRGWRIVTAFVVINIIMQTQWHGELGEAGLYLTRWKFLRWRGGLRGWRGGRGCASRSLSVTDNAWQLFSNSIRRDSRIFGSF